jgi:hypothetical protein
MGRSSADSGVGFTQVLAGVPVGAGELAGSATGGSTTTPSPMVWRWIGSVSSDSNAAADEQLEVAFEAAHLVDRALEM